MRLIILSSTATLLLCSLPLLANLSTSTKKSSHSASVVQAADKTGNKTVYVLLYNPKTEREGIHVIEDKESRTVLMFEKQKDAQRYSEQLDKLNFPVPTPDAITLSQIREFCKDNDYSCFFIHAGTNLIPSTTYDGRWFNKDKVTCDDNECRPLSGN
jgi:hypothetical protein